MEIIMVIIALIAIALKFERVKVAILLIREILLIPYSFLVFSSINLNFRFVKGVLEKY